MSLSAHPVDKRKRGRPRLDEQLSVKTASSSDDPGLPVYLSLRNLEHRNVVPDPVRDAVASRFPTAFKELAEWDNGHPLEQTFLVDLELRHRAMATMLDQVEKIRIKEGKPATPANMEAYLKSGFAGMKQAIEKKPRRYGLGKFLEQPFKPHVRQNVVLTNRIVKRLGMQPENLPKLIIDLKKLNQLEERDIPILSNPFYPYFFDTDEGYLNRTLKALDKATNFLDTEIESIDNIEVEHLIAFNAACAGRTDQEFITQPVSYQLSMKDDQLTHEGIKWLKKYINELKKEGLDIEFYKDHELTERLGEETWVLSRNGGAKEQLLTIMQKQIDKFKKEIKAINKQKLSDTQRSDEYMVAALTLSKRLEHLHPFRDANYRSISVCLLGVMLKLLGERMTVFEDSNTHDGQSPQELLSWARKGQKILYPDDDDS